MADKPSLWLRLIAWINGYIRSFKNFYKSSFLSLVIIVIILLLLTQMAQALTMMVDLMEDNPFSLLLAFFFINALAIGLSHYPIYTYYAANLNNSSKYTNWHSVFPIKFSLFKRFPVYIFTTNKDANYTPDNKANYLRYSIGILIHAVWIHFIITSFSPNLYFEDFPIGLVKGISYSLMVVPFVLYIICKEKITKLSKQEDTQRLNRFYKVLGVWYFLIAFFCFLLMIITLLLGTFSPASFVLLLLTSYAFMFNYVFFRLLRTKLTKIRATLSSPLHLPISLFIGCFTFLEKSEHYILLFFFNFIIATVLLVYSTLGSIYGWELGNGIPILLAFFYFYYFMIANIGKYFFVTKKMKLFGSRKYKILFISLATIVLLLVISNFGGVEVTTHQLDQVENKGEEITEDVFLENLRGKQDSTLFFIASHGGGLKANVWTLNVLNTLQRKTKGKLFDRTVALSGASGGSLGLALYTGLYKEDGINLDRIQEKIDSIAVQNYTSLDLSMTFGIDTYRKIWPLSQKIGIRDRPYYAMIKYQNCVEDENSETLSEVPFRAYWKQGYDQRGYMPSLIMNTAGTKGNRGILWSVKPKNFNTIFPYAVDLADLAENKTLPFYQAVSTTNRFPIFSPAAKINGYGHFIDAGAIDNSGLLGCLDMFGYLSQDTTLFKGKRIVFIEIINGKSLYINNLLEAFKEHKGISYIPINENETDNIVADLKTGLNLDKIPRYLSDYVDNLEATGQDRFRHYEIYMPHKVLVQDVEGVLGGYITDETLKKELVDFLQKKKDEILSITDMRTSFFDEWQYYEPTLSRHLSKSSINYIKTILNDSTLVDQFDEINGLINPN